MAALPQGKRRIALTQIQNTPSTVDQPVQAPQNILSFLQQMQGQCITRRSHRNSRKASSFLRSLTLHKSYSYDKVIQTTSRRPIHYDQNSIYMGDFTSQLAVGSRRAAKKPFKHAPFSHNIEDYLFVQAPHPTACDECTKVHCCKPSLLALSTRNSLNKLLVIHFNVETGYIRHFTLDVLMCYKSAKLDWNVAYESVCVSLYVKPQKMYKLLYLSVFPIAYKGCINVYQDIKGAGVIKKVILSLNMLIFHEGKSTVTLYDISSTLDNLNLSQSDAININNVNELPPPLLSVKDCEGFDLQIGGFPYRLLIATTAGRYIIRNVHNNSKIGIIEPIDSTSIVNDSIMFDETESGQIIQKGEHSVRVFQIPTYTDNLTQLHPYYPITDLKFVSAADTSRPTTSRSGRTLTQRYNPQDDSQALPTVLCELDLEDELDLLYTLTCDHEATPPQLYVNILDCHTLALLKKQKLHFKMPQRANAYEYDMLFPISVSADRDLLIINWKVSSKYCMNIYQLSHITTGGNLKQVSLINQ